MAITATIDAKLNTTQLLSEVLREIKFLREEVSFFLPQENLNEYAHPERIKSSYERAIKKYPPNS